MKNILPSLLLVVLALACSPHKKAGGEKDADPMEQMTKSMKNDMGDVNNPDQSISLADHLRRVPGVVVSGSGVNAVVTIRGMASVNSSNEPLFVVDGQQVGNGYASVVDMVNVNDIKSVRVLKDPGETGIYGARGANGVIEIRMKKDRN